LRRDAGVAPVIILGLPQARGQRSHVCAVAIAVAHAVVIGNKVDADDGSSAIALDVNMIGLKAAIEDRDAYACAIEVLQRRIGEGCRDARRPADVALVKAARLHRTVGREATDTGLR